MSTPNTHFGAVEIGKMLSDCKSIFFIGIGGINMSSLAHISYLRGYGVGGSDRTETQLTADLEQCGIKIYYTHEASHLEGYDAVVYTVAVSPDNPEYKEAQRLSLPLISRADYLGYIMTSYKNRVGVSGMHGKSTCTSMCAMAFIEATGDPTVLSGAELEAIGGAYRIGGEDNFIFEACEYMDSFLDFNPTVAIILNIEMDHVDYFSSMTQIRRSFSNFASLTGDAGTAIVNADDDNVMLAMRSFSGRHVSFSTVSGDADYYADNIVYDRGRASFDIVCRGERTVHVALSVPGAHNVYNALAAVAAASECGLDIDLAAAGVSRFTGAKRRMEYKGRLNGADVYDDYGHHPTEVEATLKAFRGISDGRLICVFQSHTYSRTAKLFDDFADALCVADRVIVADIYAARETDTMGVSGERLADEVNRVSGNGKRAIFGGDFESIASVLSAEVRNGDTVVVMGAGDIYKVFTYLNL